MFEKPPIEPAGTKVLAPFDKDLLDTIYSNITILPCLGFLPSMPSPKVT